MDDTQQIEQAIQVIEQGETEKGLELLERVQKQGDHQVNYSVAQAYFQLGLIDKAKAIVDELLLLYPDEGELYIFAAELYIDLDEEDEAIEMLLEIDKNDPTFLQAQLLLADLYQLQGLDEVAEQKLLKAAKVAPDEPIVAFGLAEFYLDRGDYGKSIPLYKKVLHHEESISDMNVDLRIAEAYSANGQFEEALRYYKQGLDDKAELTAIFGYAYTALQLGEYTLAVEQFSTLKQLDPQYSSLYPYLAQAYEHEGLYAEAMDTIVEGISVDEYNENLYVEAGKLCLRKQEPVEAESFLRKALALNPSNFEAFRTLASSLYQAENYEQVIELISYMKDYGEEDPLFEWYLASAHRFEDEFDQAFKHYQQAEIGFSEDVEFIEEYGQFLLEFGHRDEAIVKFKKVLQLDQNRLEVKDLLLDLEDQV